MIAFGGRLPFRLSALLLLLLGLSALQQPKAPRLVAALKHTSPLLGASFSADGRQLVTADGSFALVWDTSNGRKLGELVIAERMQNVRHGAGGHVAAVSLGAVTLFDKKLQQVARLEAPSGWPRDAAFSSDGRLLALGFEDERPPESHTGGVVLYDAATGQQRSRLSENGPIYRVEFRKDGKRLVAESSNRSGTFCNVYDAAGAFVKSWYAFDLTWSPDGKRFALARGKKVEVYTGDETLVWSQALEEPAGRLSFSANSKLLLVQASRSKSVTVWDAAKGKLAGRLDYGGIVVQSCLHPKQPWVAAGLANGEVSLRDVRTGKPAVEGVKAGSEVTCLAFDASGRRLAVGEKSAVCSLWELP